MNPLTEWAAFRELGLSPDVFRVRLVTTRTRPALVDRPSQPIRDHLVLGASKGSHLTIRNGKWLYIGAKGSGGFGSKKGTQFARGGPAAHRLTQQVNSDIKNGKLKPDSPPAQLYDLEDDRSQTQNLYNSHPEIVKQMSELLKKCRSSGRTAPTQ